MLPEGETGEYFSLQDDTTYFVKATAIGIAGNDEIAWAVRFGWVDVTGGTVTDSGTDNVLFGYGDQIYTWQTSADSTHQALTLEFEFDNIGSGSSETVDYTAYLQLVGATL